MSRFQSALDQQFQAAMKRGDFDDLPGKGQPIADLSSTDTYWWVRAKMKAEGLDSGVPLVPTLALRAEAPVELERIRGLRSESAVRDALSALNERIRSVNSRQIEGPSSNVMPVDVEGFVRNWSATR